MNDGKDGDYVHANYVKNEPDAKNEKDKEKYFMNDFITTQVRHDEEITKDQRSKIKGSNRRNGQ